MRRSNSNGLPVYRKIQNTLRDRIEAGELRTGDLVDSERDLAREGIVERHPGSGTFVAQPKIHFNRLTSYTEQMASRSRAVQSRVVDTSASVTRTPRRVLVCLRPPY